MRLGLVGTLLLVFPACGPESRMTVGSTISAELSASSFYHVDQEGFLGELARDRPDLLGTKNAAYGALMVRPAYRAEILSTSMKLSDLVAHRYSDAQRASDAAWVTTQKDAELRLRRDVEEALAAAGVSPGDRTDPRYQAVMATFPVKPAAYPIDSFVGYYPDEGGSIWDERGLVWLIYFCFNDIDADVTPETFHAYVEALGRDGFHGDAKIPVLPGQTRFQYNNIIVHAHSRADALLAEQIGVDLFSSTLASIGRGLDVTDRQGGQPWSDYLFDAYAGDPTTVPSDALDFVRYR
jgi:hypothetical protein